MRLESRRPSRLWPLFGVAALAAACSAGPDDVVGQSEGALLAPDGPTLSPDVADRLPKYRRLRDLARRHGIEDTGYLFAGIGITETGLVHCWSEATWACQGPRSADCGGGPVIAGAADGPCSHRQGGLGMFQFDAGTYADTIATYGERVLSLDGQVPLAIAYVVRMVKNSIYIAADLDTDDEAMAWLNAFDATDAGLRDQWVRTVVRYYNGCQPSWSCWQPRLRTYAEGLSLAISEPGGPEFWSVPTTN